MLALKNTEYYEPVSLEEAIKLLRKFKGEAKVLAGGTDLFISLRNNSTQLKYMINIKKIPELSGVSYDPKGGLVIGPLTTMNEVAEHEVIRREYSLLSQAAGKIGSYQVRNRATLGGNLCHAAPSAETAPPLLTLEVKLNLVGPVGERVVPIEKFFIGPGETILNNDEIIKAIVIPPLQERTAGCYVKHSYRKAMDIAVVGVAMLLTLDANYCKNARIGLGAVAPIPIRALQTEAYLKGKELTYEVLQQAGEIAAHEVNPISDIRGSREYRIEMIKVQIRRAAMTIIESLNNTYRNSL